jgi:hypothetical protein
MLYYGYRYTKTTDSEFVIELGELSCPEQAEWLRPRLKWLGALIAHFLSKRINKGDIPDPGPFNSSPQPSKAWDQLYGGITYQNYDIPRRDLVNPTLNRALGLSAEPFGTIIQYQNHEFVQGKVSWFGGPEDRWVADDETGTLTGEILRQLASDDYYCAMRWNYQSNKQFWANRHLLVLNSENGKAVLVRAIDWGPNTTTRRILDLSRKTLEYLSAETDDILLCAFANTDNSVRKVGPIE